MTEDQIKQMVSRFLQWKLPADFAPDGGISFKAEFNEHTAHPMRHEPVGTNLFNAMQAEAMIRHLLSPSDVTPEDDLAQAILAEMIRARTKFPGKNVTFAALVEEVGELATATFEESAERVRKEAIQVAVMAMRMVLDGDHCFDAWRREKGLDHLDPAKRSAQGEELSPAEDTELTRLRALIAGLDPDHWGLQARVVALKAEALREGGA